MCLTSADERLELNRRFKSLSKKKRFKVCVELVLKGGRVKKILHTPEAYFDFCDKHGVHVCPRYIFDTFLKALESEDQRTIFIHHFLND